MRNETELQSCKRNTNGLQVVGRQDGSISLFELRLPPVHSLYKERYAYRDQLTEIVVCHLLSQQRGFYQLLRFQSSAFQFKLTLSRNTHLLFLLISSSNQVQGLSEESGSL